MKKSKVNFRLEYVCSDREVIMIVVKKQRGNVAYLMKKNNGDFWEADILKDETTILNYFYIVVSSEVVDKRGDLLKQDISPFILRREEGVVHSVDTSCFKSSMTIVDSWRDKTKYMPFYSTPFINIFNKKSSNDEQVCGHVTFEVFAPFVGGGRKIAITGSSKLLGSWRLSESVDMVRCEFPMWRVSLPLFDEVENIEYKFVVKKGDNVESYEIGANRNLSVSSFKNNALISIYEPNFGEPKIKLAGFALPVFSMRTENSFGIGDFSALKLAVDWAVKTSQSVIQILPINDTTKDHSWDDSYPYSPISTAALHPLYVDVDKIGVLKNSNIYRNLKAKATELNMRSELDYVAVDKLKWQYLRAIFAQEVNNMIEADDFISWFKTNMSWVEPYSFFCAFREKFKTTNFEKWGDYSTFDIKKCRDLALNNFRFNDEVMLHVFVQYHLHLQLTEVSDYARLNGVIIKGDVQIGVDRYSVDVWQHPELFKCESQIGAPPDDFAAEGQNWGFPAYNWEVMQKDNYKWWVSRFKELAKYFDAYRIDHLLGFFRIWEIPLSSKSGLLGHFVPALAFNVEELQNYGFEFDRAKHLEPYITEDMLSCLFSERRLEYVKTRFFDVDCDGLFRFKSEYDSYEKLESSENMGVYKDLNQKLKSIFTDRLFIKDSVNSELLHPRILAQKTYCYSCLSDDQKRAYNALYDDYFYKRNNEFWRDNVMKKLPAIVDSTRMLACVEDLGMIPAVVPEVINDLELLALEVERMPKQSGYTIADPSQYPYYSVATTSTHDMAPIRVWWEEDAGISDYYYHSILNHHCEKPLTLDASTAYEVVKRCVDSKSMLAILPLQDWFAIDEAVRRKSYMKERINTPANVKNHWKYRMHISFERLLDATSVNKKIQEIIINSDREF